MTLAKKYNVLVFPCGSEIGLEIHKSLNVSTHFNLFGGSSVDDHGKFVYKNYIDSIPYIDDDSFTQKFNDIITSFNIDFVFPAHDNVLLKLASARANKKLNCEVITSAFETCSIVRSKYRTYEFFKNIVPVPKIFEDIDLLKKEDFPLFLKPDIGQGSKGTFLARTIEEVNFYLKKDSSLLILEYLPGKEYTIDCFTDKNGDLLFCEGRQRNRISNGISVNSFSKKDDRFIQFARKINDTLKFRGVWFFQVKENASGDFVLMEIAPRVAGTMGLVRCKGVNLPLLSLFDALDYKIDIFENSYKITIDRALENKYIHNIRYENVYLDLDDTVIFNNKVNPAIISFIFQCFNNNVKVFLITKHKGNLEETLKNYKLENIFDKVILLNNEDEKYLYIKEEDAIFIDDSFIERKKVFEKCCIPVFDSHMIESLIDKF